MTSTGRGAGGCGEGGGGGGVRRGLCGVGGRWVGGCVYVVVSARRRKSGRLIDNCAISCVYYSPGFVCFWWWWWW